MLGEIRELGALSVPEHTALGDLVATAGIDVLVAVGARDVAARGRTPAPAAWR